MPEPRPDRVEVDTGLQEMRCGRMANDVRAYPLALRRGGDGPQLRDISLDEGVNAVARVGLATTVYEQTGIVGPLACETAKLLDCLAPEWATALLAPLACDPNGLGMPVDITYPHTGRLAHACPGIVEEQQQRVVACSLERRSVRGRQQRIDLSLLDLGNACRDALLDRDHPELGGPLDMLRAALSDEAGQRMNRGEALIACGD